MPVTESQEAAGGAAAHTAETAALIKVPRLLEGVDDQPGQPEARSTDEPPATYETPKVRLQIPPLLPNDFFCKRPQRHVLVVFAQEDERTAQRLATFLSEALRRDEQLEAKAAGLAMELSVHTAGDAGAAFDSVDDCLVAVPLLSSGFRQSERCMRQLKLLRSRRVSVAPVNCQAGQDKIDQTVLSDATPYKRCSAESAVSSVY